MPAADKGGPCAKPQELHGVSIPWIDKSVGLGGQIGLGGWRDVGGTNQHPPTNPHPMSGLGGLGGSRGGLSEGLGASSPVLGQPTASHACAWDGLLLGGWGLEGARGRLGGHGLLSGEGELEGGGGGFGGRGRGAELGLGGIGRVWVGLGRGGGGGNQDGGNCGRGVQEKVKKITALLSTAKKACSSLAFFRRAVQVQGVCVCVCVCVCLLLQDLL
jgi:hypothetical protein